MKNSRSDNYTANLSKISKKITHASFCFLLRLKYLSRNLEVDGCSSKENLFGQSAFIYCFPKDDL